MNDEIRLVTVRSPGVIWRRHPTILLPTSKLLLLPSEFHEKQIQHSHQLYIFLCVFSTAT